jgi:hypothetical protein
LSADLPRACSGDRYWAVPMTAEVCVIAEVESVSARAIPKSITFTAPVLVIMMFAGLMSRWMMPASWENASARHTSAITRLASSSGMAPESCTISRRVSPWTRSMTMYGTEPLALSVWPVS